MNEREYHRSLEEIWTDLLWPGSGVMGPDPEQSTRHYAIMEVLRSIPQDDYDCLKDAVDSFDWYIPHYDVYGEVRPFPISVYKKTETDTEHAYAKVLYLSPRLEQSAAAIVLAVVAHELAHIILEHPVFTRPANTKPKRLKSTTGFVPGALKPKSRNIPP